MHPVQVHRNIQENNSNPKKEYQDCTSCRIWGSLFHLGVAGFVAKHYKEMPTKGSKAFIAVFSTGVAYLGVARAFNLYPFSLILAKNNNITSDQSSIASN